MTSEAGTPVNMNESVDIALKDHKGKVMMIFPRPVPHIIFEPQNAFNVAENLARCAHKARFPGDRLPEDFSYLAQQVKQRLTDQMRDRLAVRVRAMLPSLLESKDLNYASVQIVDTIFAALDSEGDFKL